MVRQMQIVFPIVAKIQAEVISRYGFTSNGPGSVQFIQVGTVGTKELNNKSQITIRMHWKTLYYVGQINEVRGFSRAACA